MIKIKRLIAKILYWFGCKPSYSTGIHDKLTCGYGELSHDGFWEYSLSDGEENRYTIIKNKKK
ncbi:MAG TPA: hypothetical protein VMZ91_06495 [Candidatus Paceibacterota bacterium]|nr:hypothetical protein [Candidatus Paceibacterota bacterium]